MCCGEEQLSLLFVVVVELSVEEFDSYLEKEYWSLLFVFYNSGGRRLFCDLRRTIFFGLID